MLFRAADLGERQGSDGCPAREKTLADRREGVAKGGDARIGLCHQLGGRADARVMKAAGIAVMSIGTRKRARKRERETVLEGRTAGTSRDIGLLGEQRSVD